MHKAMGWCDRHLTSQSDASQDFHEPEADCEGFTSAESLIPQVRSTLEKAAKVTRTSWLTAWGFYLVLATLLFATAIFSPDGIGLGKALLGAAICLVTVPVVKALTAAVIEAVILSDEDKAVIPKVEFLLKNEILVEEDLRT